MSDTIPADQRKTWKYHDVDTGFAWVVLIGCFVMYMFVVGGTTAYGVLYTEMVEYYSSGSGNTAWIGSIALILQCVLGPVANLLCKIYTFQCITVIGGILIGLGYFLSGFSTRIEYMYLTFLSTGLGYGLTFSPCLTIISYYFDKRRGLANGITVAGSGVGAICLPFLYKYLIEQYGLNGTFWIIGAISANVCVAACVFRQPRCLVEEKKEVIYADVNTSSEHNGHGGSPLGKREENSVRKTDKSPCPKLDLRFSLFKNAVFTLHVISFICCSFGYLGSIIIIPSSVKALGYNDTYVALSLTIFGGVEVLARILIGLFVDLNIIKRKYIYVVNMFIGGTFSLLAPLFENFTFIAIYATVAATFLGSFFSLIPVLIIDVVGLENFAPAFGLLSFSLAVGALPSQPAVGWLYDLTGNWHSSFILTGGMFILAGVIILLEPIVAKCCTKADSLEVQPSPADNQTQNDYRDRSTISSCKDDARF